MARPIKETPVLTGAQAKQFQDAIKQNASKKVSTDSYRRAMDTYNKVKVIKGK